MRPRFARPKIQAVYTVHGAEKPARPLLSAGMSLLGLAVALGLGAWLIQHKQASGEISLADRFVSPGWDLSFQAPVGWESETLMVPWLSSLGYQFSERRDDGAGRRLFVLRAESAACQPAVSVAQNYTPFWAPRLLGTVGMGPMYQIGSPRVKPFGPLPGAELEFMVAGVGGVARVGMQGDGTCVCAILFAKGHRPSRRLTRPLDQIVESFRSVATGGAPDSSGRLPFRAPTGTIVELLEGGILPRYRLRPDREGPESWDILLAETWLIGGRSPRELLEDLARVHRHRAEPGGEFLEFGRADRSGLKLIVSQVQELGVVFSYAIIALDEGRALLAIAGCTPQDRSSLDRALDDLVAGYELRAVEAGTPAQAEAAGRELLRRLPQEIARRREADLRQDWYLVHRVGHVQGYGLGSVGGVKEEAGQALQVRQSYVYDSAGLSLNGRYEARLTADASAYELEDRTLGTHETFPIRTQWRESRTDEGTVSRSLTANEQQIRSTFRPGDLFVPQPAMEVAAYLAANGERAVALLSTTDHLAQSFCGFILQPVSPRLLDQVEGAGSPTAPVDRAVLVATDCRPDSFELLGFDRDGALVKARFGRTITVERCAAQEVLSRFPDARRKLSGWDD